MVSAMNTRRIPILLAAVFTAALPIAARGTDAHDHDRRPDYGHGHAEDRPGGTHQPAGSEAEHHAHAHPGVDLSHPIVTESPVPETKARFNYGFADSGDADEHEAEVELEYAFTPNFSVEAILPYVF